MQNSFYGSTLLNVVSEAYMRKNPPNKRIINVPQANFYRQNLVEAQDVIRLDTQIPVLSQGLHPGKIYLDEDSNTKTKTFYKVIQYEGKFRL